MKPRPSASIRPHDGSGGCVPRPRNDSAASARMAKARLTDVCTMIGGGDVGQHVAAHDAQVAGAHRAGGPHVDLLAHAEHAGPGDPGEDRHVDDADGDHRVGRAPARGWRGWRWPAGSPGRRTACPCSRISDVVDPAPVEAGEQADRSRRRRSGDADGHDADPQRRLGADEHPARTRRGRGRRCRTGGRRSAAASRSATTCSLRPYGRDGVAEERRRARTAPARPGRPRPAGCAGRRAACPASRRRDRARPTEPGRRSRRHPARSSGRSRRRAGRRRG